MFTGVPETHSNRSLETVSRQLLLRPALTKAMFVDWPSFFSVFFSTVVYMYVFDFRIHFANLRNRV